MSNFQSWNDIGNFIRSIMVPGSVGNTTVEKIRSAFLAITNNMAVGGVDPEVDASWKIGVTYPKDIQPVLWRDMWLVSNITNNLGIEPVTAEGVVNPTWRVVGSSAGSGIRPWEAIVYGNIMEIVFAENSIYYLDRDVVGADPFLSANFITERSEGKWKSFTNAGFQLVGTYAELDTLSQNDNLIPGVEYLMTDYYTRHAYVSDSEQIHNGSVEPILIKAVSSNSFSTKARSMIYTTHELDYDFTEIRLSTVAQQFRPGLIIGRYDLTTNTYTPYDFIGCRVRLFKILDKVYNNVTQDSDTELSVTISRNIPTLSTLLRYEVKFPVITHTQGQKTINIVYNNGTITKPLKYHLDQTATGEIPADYLSEKKGTIVYNEDLDAFVLMSFRDIGAELIGTYSSPVKGDYTIGHGGNQFDRGIVYSVDTADFQDFSVFQSTYENVSLPRDYDGRLVPSVVFKGAAKNVKIKRFLDGTVFTKDIDGFTVGGGIYESIIDSAEYNHVTDHEIWSSIILDSGFGASNVDHHFTALSRSIITPTANMYLGYCDLVTIILEAGLGMEARTTIRQTSVFGTLSASSVENNSFVINSPIWRGQLGYMDFAGINLNKAIYHQSLYIESEIENILGATEVDLLKFKVLPESTTSPTIPMAFDVNGKVVRGDAIFTELAFATIAARDAYEVTNLPFQAFVEDDGDGKWAIYKATAIGLPGTYIKIIDQDLFSAVVTGAQIAAAYEGFEDVERFTTALLSKLTDIQPLAEVNDTVAEIIAKLESVVVEEDKLANTAIQGSPVYDEQLVVDELTGTLSILVDLIPTLNSNRLLSSGTIHNYLSKLSAGLDPVFSVTGDTKNLNFPKLVGKGGLIYAVSQDGTNNRFYSSVDGKFFVEGGTTSSWLFIDLDVSPHSIIIVQRNGGPGNVKRSTNNGASFDTITMPETLEITGIKYIGSGKWVLCSRTAGTGSVCAYSIDDGVTWTMATTPNTNAMQAIGYGAGVVFSVANAGTDRVLISTDYGVTYTASTPPVELYTKCVYFLGHIVLMRAGVNADPYLTISDDQGTSWSQVLPVDDSAIELKGMTVIGEWLFIYGINGYIAKTKDLSTKTVLTAPTANHIIAMAETKIDGKSVIMATCENGVDNRILTTAE